MIWLLQNFLLPVFSHFISYIIEFIFLLFSDMASYGYISDYMSSIDDDYASRKGTKPAFAMILICNRFTRRISDWWLRDGAVKHEATSEYYFETASKSKLWVLKSVYDGIFDSISDLGSIDDEIDIKVFKTNKDGETTVTEQQPADKKTKPKATKEAAKKPAAAKPSEEERFES